jgi:hypothetical protein
MPRTRQCAEDTAMPCPYSNIDLKKSRVRSCLGLVKWSQEYRLRQ